MGYVVILVAPSPQVPELVLNDFWLFPKSNSTSREKIDNNKKNPEANSLKAMSFSFFQINLLIYLFLAALGLRCCAQAFSSYGEQGLLFVVVGGLLIVVASLVAEHRL